MGDTAPRPQNVSIGGLVVTQPPAQLRAVLGSCVGIAVFDPLRKVAGLAHAILPEATGESMELGKFADQAVDNLIVSLMALGAEKSRMKAKLIGGAAMFGAEANEGLGARNVAVAGARLAQHDIAVVATATGGSKGRKMTLDPSTGKVRVEIIGEDAETI